MKPRWWRRLWRRGDRRSHRHVTVTRTVTREHVTPTPPPPVVEEEPDMSVELVSPGLLWAPAFTGGFALGVAASLVAGLIVLAIEKTINDRKDGKR